MRVAVMSAPGEVRVADRAEPSTEQPTDAVIRPAATGDRVWTRQIDPGRVPDMAVPLEDAAAGYRALAPRQGIQVLLRP